MIPSFHGQVLQINHCAIHSSASSEAKKKEFLVHGKFIEQTGKMSIKNVIKKKRNKIKTKKVTLNSGKH